MIIALFRSRLRPGVEPAYKELITNLVPIAQSIPGYIRHKAYVSEDGERVTIVEYENEDALQAWRQHPEHLAAKRIGIREFYKEYRVQICELKSERRPPSQVHATTNK